MRAVFDSKDFDKFMRSNGRYQLYRLIHAYRLPAKLPSGYTSSKFQTLNELINALPKDAYYVDDNNEISSYQFINPRNIVVIFKNKTILLIQEEDTCIILSSLLDGVIQTRVLYKNYMVCNEIIYRKFRGHRFILDDQISFAFEIIL